MKKTLKDWCKNWSVKQLVISVFQAGMMWTGRNTEERKKELNDNRRIITNEIRRRLKLKKV